MSLRFYDNGITQRNCKIVIDFLRVGQFHCHIPLMSSALSSAVVHRFM